MPQKLTETMTAVHPLRRRMIDDMSLRNLSLATQRSYETCARVGVDR